MPPPQIKSIFPAGWVLPPSITERFGESAGRQRAMLGDGHLLLILHAPPGHDDTKREARFFWRDPAGNWKASIGGVGIIAVKRHVQDFVERIEKLEAAFHTATRAGDYFEMLQTLAPIHRTTRNMHATLQQARELLPEDRELISIRDQAGEVEREAELLYADMKNGLDFTVARRSEEMAERSYDMTVSSHRLNLLAALFFPVATVSSIFGMELKHGLEDEHTPPGLFWIILLVGLMIGSFLLILIGRKPPLRP